MLFKEFDRQFDQVIKIHRLIGFKGLLINLVYPGSGMGELFICLCFGLIRADEGVFPVGNLPLCFA